MDKVSVQSNDATINRVIPVGIYQNPITGLTIGNIKVFEFVAQKSKVDCINKVDKNAMKKQNMVQNIITF